MSKRRDKSLEDRQDNPAWVRIGRLTRREQGRVKSLKEEIDEAEELQRLREKAYHQQQRREQFQQHRDKSIQRNQKSHQEQEMESKAEQGAIKKKISEKDKPQSDLSEVLSAWMKQHEENVEKNYDKFKQQLFDRLQAAETQRVKEQQELIEILQKEIKDSSTNLLKGTSEIMNKLQKQMGEMKESMDTVKKEVVELKQEVVEVREREKEKANKLIDHEKRMAYLEDQIRRKNVIIRKIPENKPDNLKLRLLTWLNELKMGRDFAPEDIESVYRLGPKKHKTGSRNVLLKFADLSAKLRLMSYIKNAGPDILKMEGVDIEIFNDIAFEERIWRNQIKPVTKKLRDKGILYNWKFSKQMRFVHLGKTFYIKEDSYVLDVLVEAKILENGTQEWKELKEALSLAGANTAKKSESTTEEAQGATGGD